LTWNTAPGVSPSGTTATNRFVLGAREPPAPPLLLLLLPAPPLLAPWFRPSETAAAADLAAAKDADEDAGNDPAAAAADAADASEAMDEEEAAVEGAGSGVCDTSWPARSMEVIKYLVHREEKGQRLAFKRRGNAYCPLTDINLRQNDTSYSEHIEHAVENGCTKPT